MMYDMGITITASVSGKVKAFSLLCAAMVVGIHVAEYQEQGTIMYWWSRIGHCGCFLIAVPFFFTVSGFFLAGHFGEAAWLRRESMKRVRSLLVPYLVWSTLGFLITISGIIASGVSPRGVDMVKLAASSLGVNPFCYPMLVPLWYLRTLMIFVFISPLIYLLARHGGVKLLLVICLAWALVILFAAGRFGLIMRYTFRLSALFYFTAGVVMRLKGCALETKSRMISFISLLLGIITLVVSIFVCEVESRLFSLFRMAFVPLLLFATWNLFPSVKLPQWLTSATFPIFCLHILVWRVLGVVASATNLSCFDFLHPASVV